MMAGVVGATVSSQSWTLAMDEGLMTHPGIPP
jgi:hypothetical protein